MEAKIIQNLFDFWKLIGERTRSFYKNPEFDFTLINHHIWPSKVFNICSENVLDFEDKIRNHEIPNAIAIPGNNHLNFSFKNSNFTNYSTVKAMFLNLKSIENSFSNIKEIELVDTFQKGVFFKEIAEKSFNYEIDQMTIFSLIGYKNIQLFIGKHENEYVTCGIIYLDKKGNSGIHMIGTIPKFRGLGLGKKMTEKLISKAIQNKSKKAFLVASKSGEKIYEKLGFQTAGTLESYKLV
ncbi:GNAT family N-acetyltransferase [Aureivirga marina]|uniref:GNAT family N-acetyltransferase n=1 Tax=Aureivirga marina TaxID=1182451 RepID=UPI0018CA2FD7|nr:GNAT family N-acetyltransferase [Aureivirga marina]